MHCALNGFSRVFGCLPAIVGQQTRCIGIVDHPGRHAALASQCLQQRFEMVRLRGIDAEAVGGLLSIGIVQTHQDDGFQR